MRIKNIKDEKKCVSWTCMTEMLASLQTISITHKHISHENLAWWTNCFQMISNSNFILRQGGGKRGWVKGRRKGGCRVGGTPSYLLSWVRCTTIVGNECRKWPWALNCKQFGGAWLLEALRAERSSGFVCSSFDQFQIILPNPIFIHNIHNLLNKKRFYLVYFYLC